MEDQWLADYEAADHAAKETLRLIQARRQWRRRERLRRGIVHPCSLASCTKRPWEAAELYLHQPLQLYAPCCLPAKVCFPASWPQERNLQFPEGGPEASRITATCRRKLGTLGGLLDGLRTSLEEPQLAGL